MSPSSLVEPLLTAVQILGAILLFAYKHPKRERFGLRVAILAVCVAAFAVVGTWVGTTVIPALSTTYSMPTQFVLFSLILVAAAPILMLLFDVSVWTALFCSTAGYTLQNLTSGLEGMVALIWDQLGLPGANTVGTFTAIYLISTAATFVACYLLLVRRVDREGLGQVESQGMFAMVIAVVLVVILFDIVIKSLTAEGATFYLLILLRVVHIIVCSFVLFAEYQMLYGQRWRADATAMERLIADSERQYRLSRESIDAINIKCHDLKHQIRSLREEGAVVSEEALGELEEAVGIYDSAVKTGNDALDVILSEKSLICEQSGITLSCIADGACLSRMAASDLYSLFGNALDNAIEAVSKLSDASKRSISLVVRESHGAASIHVENYCEGELEFRDSLPVTTKRNAAGSPDEANHGFGMKSMRHICERYGGTLTTSAAGGVFKLDALIPLER